MDMVGKRVRHDSQVFNSVSMESTSCSSVYSQYTQRVNNPYPTPSAQKDERLLSQQLLSMLEKSTSLPTLNYTASQGARGIQPPLTINDIRSIVVIVRVWIKVTLDMDPAETEVDVAELTKILESIGKYYLLWSLSPGMQVRSTDMYVFL